jgi:hypothetical protein
MLALGRNMTPEIIYGHSYLPWEYGCVSGNINLTSDFVLNNLDKNWSMDMLSANSMHNYPKEKRLIRDRIQKAVNLNRFLYEMREDNTYFKYLVKDIVDLISVYY